MLDIQNSNCKCPQPTNQMNFPATNKVDFSRIYTWELTCSETLKSIAKNVGHEETFLQGIFIHENHERIRRYDRRAGKTL